VKEEAIPLALDIPLSIGVALDSEELASTIDTASVYKRVISPAVSSIAQSCESTMIDRATLATNNGAVVTDVTGAAMLAAGQRMTEQLAPLDGERYALLDPSANSSAITQRASLFNGTSEIAKQYKSGVMGQADGFTYMQNNLLARKTLGNDVTGVAVDDTVAEGASTIHFDGVTTGTGTVTAGSIITIAGVYDVHPITKVALTNLKQFVVTTGGTASGTSDIDLTLSPALYATGSLQNVSALPADDASVTFVGAASTAYTNSLTYHKDAYRMVSVPLVMPEQAEFAVQETYEGVTVSIIRDWDQLKRRMVTRVDFLGGFAATRPEWAYRILRA